MSYNPNNANGQATSANSQPVVLASDQTISAPHNLASAYTIVHKDAVYTGSTTGTTIWAPTSGKKFAITDMTIAAGGTTAGVITIYDASSGTAFTAGSTPTIFRNEVAPSTTSRPTIVKVFNVPYVGAATNNNVIVNLSANINPVYIQINGYEF